MNKQYLFLIMLFAMLMSIKTHRCYAQGNAETTTQLTISVIADSTGKPIAGAEIRVEGSDGNTQTDSTNKNGIASFSAMNKNVVYVIQVASPSYYTERTKLFLTDTISDQHIEFRMTKIPSLGTPLPQIVFRRNSIRITKMSEDELKIISIILVENPGITIAISGHTAPDEKEITGQKRAEKIRTIFINQRIDAARMSIDTTQQCETDSEGIEYISNYDNRGKIITKAYLKKLSGKERRNVKRSCMTVRFRITGTEFGE